MKTKAHLFGPYKKYGIKKSERKLRIGTIKKEKQSFLNKTVEKKNTYLVFKTFLRVLAYIL